MAKINRATQKIFASNANENSITQFGTAKNAEPNYTSDVETIQGSSAYLTGWANSLETDLAPFMQDSNALWYMITSQVAYLFQQGVPEYDTETEYSIGSLCKVIDNGNVNIYKSLTNNNIGNDDFSAGNANWALYSTDGNMAFYEIGLPQPSLSGAENPLQNELWLDGSSYSSENSPSNPYYKLFQVYGYRYGGSAASGQFAVPNMTGRVLWGTNYLDGVQGTGYVDATLPNIKGSFGGAESGSKADLYNTGAFYTGATNKMQGGSSDNDADVTYFDANRYNNIYRDNATVRPPAVLVRWKTRYY